MGRACRRFGDNELMEMLPRDYLCGPSFSASCSQPCPVLSLADASPIRHLGLGARAAGGGIRNTKLCLYILFPSRNISCPFPFLPSMMRMLDRIIAWLGFISLLSPLLSIASATRERAQQPLVSQDHDTAEAAVSGDGWNFNFTSSAPHYFASVYGSLQQWPQTFFPNGHSIVPCELPPLTKLYHGRRDGDEPPSPEWMAFDMYVQYTSQICTFSPKQLGCTPCTDQ